MQQEQPWYLVGRVAVVVVDNKHLSRKCLLNFFKFVLFYLCPFPDEGILAEGDILALVGIVEVVNRQSGLVVVGNILATNVLTIMMY